MIKLQLSEPPEELSLDNERDLVAQFKASHTDVWNKPYIRNALLKMSYGKCAYSEIMLNEESKYMEVEHFKSKSKYPDSVVEWGNLLPSCKKCNVAKGDWDVLQTPIVNPLIDNPVDYLYIKDFRFYGRNSKGQDTIDCLDINNRVHFIEPRARVWFMIEEKLDLIFNYWSETSNLPRKNKLKSSLLYLMRECDKRNAYSAVLSTYLLYYCDNYRKLKDSIVSENLWTTDLQEKENELAGIAMPEKKK